MDLRNHKHTEMIGHIIAEIHDILSDPSVGPEEKVYLCKVKAHNGITGNEVTDSIAKDAANRKKKIDVTCPAPSTPSYAANYWPYRKRLLEDGTPRMESLVNLSSDLHSYLHDKHKLGYTNKDSVYYQAWQAIQDQVDTSISMQFTKDSSVPFGARRVSLMYRHGTLWTNKAAFRCRMRTNKNCPLCPGEDGISHIAGGCSHSAMNRMYTERHNHTGRILLKAISKGSMGGNLAMDG
jgi:hypothetical protein